MTNEQVKKTISATLADIELLECSICCNNLTDAVFQCQFGHCVCEPCWLKLGYICSTCKNPLGLNRCKIVEKIIKKTSVRCPNDNGCGELVAFAKINKHVLDGCRISKCFCPYFVLCKEKGDPEWIVDHFLHSHWPTEKYKSFFELSAPFEVAVINTIDVWCLFCWNRDALFAYQCFKEEEGVWVDVTCIAPPASEMYNFSYVLSYNHEDQQMTYACPQMTKKVRMVFGYPNRSTAYLIPKIHLERWAKSAAHYRLNLILFNSSNCF